MTVSLLFGPNHAWYPAVDPNTGDSAQRCTSDPINHMADCFWSGQGSHHEGADKSFPMYKLSADGRPWRSIGVFTFCLVNVSSPRSLIGRLTEALSNIHVLRDRVSVKLETLLGGPYHCWWLLRLVATAFQLQVQIVLQSSFDSIRSML